MEREELREMGLKVLELRERTECLLENVRNDFAGFCVELASRLKVFVGEEDPAVTALERLGRELALATLGQGVIDRSMLSRIEKVYGEVARERARVLGSVPAHLRGLFGVLFEDLERVVAASLSDLSFRGRVEALERGVGELLASAGR